MPKLNRRTFVTASLASAASGVFASLAHAQISPSPLPGAANGGTSAVVQPGMRLTWLEAAASIPGERSQIVPGPDGTWINQRTGQHYREFNTPGPAGAGYTVGDVQASAGNSVLSWLALMLINPDQSNATSFLDAHGAYTTAQDVGDHWIPPAQLATFADRNHTGIRVMRVPYPLGGRTYRAVRIQMEVGGGWSQSTYDLDTGLLLVGSSTAQGAPTLVRGPGNVITSGAGSTQMIYRQLSGVRRTSLPGPGTTYPTAIRQLRSLAYTGSRGFILPGSPVPPTPVQIRYDIASNSGSHLNARMSMSNMATGNVVEDRIFPAGVIGGLWMNPDVLGRYAANQVLDNDPVSGVQATSLGRQGNLAYVALQTRIARRTFGYDLRTGLLTQAEQRQQNGQATDVLAVQLAGSV